MFPILEPSAALSQPVASGLAWLAFVAAAGAVAVVQMVARANARTPRARATVTPLGRRLPEAA
jgi:hypothetical protein